MLFVQAATTEMTDEIDFFESSNINIHNAADKLDTILYTQMMRVLEESELNEFNEDQDKIERKSRGDLL